MVIVVEDKELRDLFERFAKILDTEKGNIDGNDIVATLLDLNNRGYINIEYKMLGGVEKSILTLTDKERFISLKDYENYLLDEIFKETNEVIFDDFVSSDKFKKVFKTVGEMIKKRVSFKSIHKISHKRNYSKINFLTNYILFGFSFIYPLFYFVFKDYVVLALILSYLVSYFLFFFYKIITNDKKYRLDQLIISSSLAISILVFGLFGGLYILDNLNMEINAYINIANILLSLISIITMVFIKKESKISILDIIYILFGLSSMFINNYTGLCLTIIYLSRKIYFLVVMFYSYVLNRDRSCFKSPRNNIISINPFSSYKRQQDYQLPLSYHLRLPYLYDRNSQYKRYRYVPSAP